MENTKRTARQIQVHFFNFASVDLPLFLPKKVSLEPPKASIPCELLGCYMMQITLASAEIPIRIIMVMLSPMYSPYDA